MNADLLRRSSAFDIITKPGEIMAEQFEYSEKVMDHFRNPRNVGELKDADGVGRVGNPVCGDLMEIQIKVENNILKDVKFKTFGCGSAIATSSMITEMAIGKTLEEALKITRGDVAAELDGLPRSRCTARTSLQMRFMPPSRIT